MEIGKIISVSIVRGEGISRTVDSFKAKITQLGSSFVQARVRKINGHYEDNAQWFPLNSRNVIVI